MKKFLSLLLILAGACADNDTRTFDKASAMKRAAALCNTSPSNMQWLSHVLDKAQRGGELEGVVYAFRYSKGVAIVHQPLIMSCLACSLYDCSGTLVTDREEIQEEIMNGIKDENLILKPW